MQNLNTPCVTGPLRYENVDSHDAWNWDFREFAKRRTGKSREHRDRGLGTVQVLKWGSVRGCLHGIAGSTKRIVQLGTWRTSPRARPTKTAPTADSLRNNPEWWPRESTKPSVEPSESHPCSHTVVPFLIVADLGTSALLLPILRCQCFVHDAICHCLFVLLIVSLIVSYYSCWSVQETMNFHIFHASRDLQDLQ